MTKVGNKVLFAGDCSPYTTSCARAQALESAGVRLLILNTANMCRHPLKLINVLAHRLYCTPEIFRFNRILLKHANSERPDFVWIEKGRWVFPCTLKKLRAIGCKLIHYNTDDVFSSAEYWWLHRLGLKYYDLALTTNRYNVSEIREKYQIYTCRAGMGYDDKVYAPPATIPTGGVADVLFVGHREQHTEDFLVALINAKFRVAVFGYEWKRSRHRLLRRTRPLPQSDYCQAIASARMTLCVLSRRNRNESTGRTFEIPAIGGCLLAEDTPEHRYLFRPDIEAFYFSDTLGLLSKARDILNRDGLRQSVAAAGRRRCIEMGMSWRDHILREWKIARDICTTGTASGDILVDDPFWPGYRNGVAYAAARCGP